MLSDQPVIPVSRVVERIDAAIVVIGRNREYIEEEINYLAHLVSIFIAY